MEIWLDFRREVFTSNSSPLYTSIPVQQCTIFISIVNERNPIQINIEKNNFSLMYYMGLLSGTNLFGIQDAMSLYSLCIGSIFRIHLKVAMSFRLLSNHDCLDPIFSWQQNPGKIECFSFQKLHQTSQIAFILLLVLSWTDNHGQSTWFAWLPQANFASAKLHAASYLSGNTWLKVEKEVVPPRKIGICYQRKGMESWPK